MKLSAAFVLALTSVACSSPILENFDALSKRASNAFAVGTKINIEGSTNYFVGANSNWASYLTNDGDVDVTFAHLKASGVKVFRVWGFKDVSYIVTNPQTVWFQSLPKWNPVSINTGTNGLSRLDAVVKAAEKYGIKLIIPFVNWVDEGSNIQPHGVGAYANYYATLKNGWYTDSSSQAQYRKYVATVINRYKSSTAVLSWELINEPRCPGCASSVITQWATSTSAFVKSLDSTHLVALGDEGFLNSEGIDFEANLKIPSIDLGTFHLSSKVGITGLAAQIDWIKTHAAISKKVGKPTIFEAYGDASTSVRQTWQDTAFALREDGLAGDLIWQWGENLPVAGTTPNDANTVFYGSAAWQTLVKNHATRANA